MFLFDFFSLYGRFSFSSEELCLPKLKKESCAFSSVLVACLLLSSSLVCAAGTASADDVAIMCRPNVLQFVRSGKRSAAPCDALAVAAAQLESALSRNSHGKLASARLIASTVLAVVPLSSDVTFPPRALRQLRSLPLIRRLIEFTSRANSVFASLSLYFLCLALSLIEFIARCRLLHVERMERTIKKRN